MNWLFQDFLGNSAVYQQAQQYWERLFRSSLPQFFAEEHLRVNKFNNPDSDGNPIFTAVCRPIQLAVRVIQQPVGEPGDIDLDSWLGTVSFGSRGLELQELVISCCPSKENEREVKRLLHDWFLKGVLPQCSRSTNTSPGRGGVSRTHPNSASNKIGWACR